MASVSAACVVTTILVCAAGVHAKAVLQLALSNQLSTHTHTHPSVGPQRNDIWSQTDRVRHWERFSDATMFLYFLLPQIVFCNSSVLQHSGSPLGNFASVSSIRFTTGSRLNLILCISTRIHTWVCSLTRTL